MRHAILTAAILLCGIISSTAQTLPYQNTSLPIEERIEDLISRMTLEEKIAQMSHIHSKHYDNGGKADTDKLMKSLDGMSRGCMEAFPYSLQQYVDAVYDIQKKMIEGTRLGIPVIPVVEGLHGVVQDGCTIYPQAIAQGATFNPELIEEMAFQIAREARSIGAWQVLSPCLDVARELRWGRVEETFGEDPYMNSVNGTAYVSGAQKGGLICTPKHFVAHGTPSGGVNLASVSGGLYDLYNVYLPPFKMIIDKCAPLSIMNCYSSYDGEVITGSRFFLNDLLRGDLGFKGYVYSDWGSIGMLRYFHKVAADASEAARMAIEAGLDLEASSVEYDTAAELVRSGRLDIKYIDEAVRNILYAKFRSGVFDSPLPDRSAWKSTIHNPESVQLSKRMAIESAVLLENNGLLPLDAGSLKSVAVIGPNAARVQFGDYSWGADAEYGVTPLKGLTAFAKDDFRIEYAEGCDLWSQDKSGFNEAVKAARKSDVALVFVGSQSALLARKSEPATSGEGYDLSSLKLPGVQEELIDAIVGTGTPVVVVLVTGKPFELIRIREKVEAVVVQWYAGEEQGTAIADLLFGKENFSGRLPVSFPKSVGQLPCHYNWLPTDKGYYNRKGSISNPGRDYVFSDPYALYDFGYGLSYSKFEYTGMEAELAADGTVKVQVKVRNISERTGMETVQIYSNDVASSRVTPVKKLVAYRKVEIRPGEQKTVNFSIPAERLGFYDNSYRLCVEPGDFKIMCGSSSNDIHFTSVITFGGKVAVEVTSAADTNASSEAVGKETIVTLTVRDIQASVLEGVAVGLNGEVIATTSTEGSCIIRIPSGAVLSLTKEGYDTLDVEAGTESQLSVTMVPAF